MSRRKDRGGQLDKHLVRQTDRDEQESKWADEKKEADSETDI